MRIASFTMFGQYPHGIDLHVRNLKWALTKDDHIYIVTLPDIIKQFNLKDEKNVTYVPFVHLGEGDFINFWAGFPGVVKNLNINPKWFLFMEGDIWFHKKPGFVPKDIREVANYLPLQNHYHAITVDDKVIQPRLWEGGCMAHGDLIRRAIDYPINFSFAKPFFYEQDKEEWEKKVGGKIGLKYFKLPDTFDEFGLYCALVEKSKICYFDRCVHLRGPESLHRKYPGLYETCKEQDLEEPAKKLPYLDVYGAIAPYYIDGHWKGSLPWGKMKPEFQAEFVKLLPTAKEWMKPDEFARLVEVAEAFKSSGRPASSPAPASPLPSVKFSTIRSRRIRGRSVSNPPHQ